MECAGDVFTMSLRDDYRPNHALAANRRYGIEFMSHLFYNIVGFGRRALPAPVVEL